MYSVAVAACAATAELATATIAPAITVAIR